MQIPSIRDEQTAQKIVDPGEGGGTGKLMQGCVGRNGFWGRGRGMERDGNGGEGDRDNEGGGRYSHQKGVLQHISYSKVLNRASRIGFSLVEYLAAESLKKKKNHEGTQLYIFLSILTLSTTLF